jgi:predicted membrane-bound spermidine synthase
MIRLCLNVLAVLFTLTGGTALLAEHAFEKLLSALLGASTPAAAMVLAVYFGGLTVGGILFGACRGHISVHPLRLYAALELGAGLWALLLYLAFDKLIQCFVPLLALEVDRFWSLQLFCLIGRKQYLGRFGLEEQPKSS